MLHFKTFLVTNYNSQAALFFEIQVIYLSIYLSVYWIALSENEFFSYRSTTLPNGKGVSAPWTVSAPGADGHRKSASAVRSDGCCCGRARPSLRVRSSGLAFCLLPSCTLSWSGLTHEKTFECSFTERLWFSLCCFYGEWGAEASLPFCSWSLLIAKCSWFYGLVCPFRKGCPWCCCHWCKVGRLVFVCVFSSPVFALKEVFIVFKVGSLKKVTLKCWLIIFWGVALRFC